MFYKKNLILIVSLSLLTCGCGFVMETAKTIWGSSTRALEQARGAAIEKSYLCGFDDCFDVLLTMDRNSADTGPKTEKFYEVFLKNRRRGVIVVMGILGNVDTTEVGIFLTPVDDYTVSIEVTSLSTSAKEKVAGAVFGELGKHFRESVQPI